MLADRRTYEIMDAESVGLSGSDIVLGKHSGRHALRQAFADLGFTIEGDELRRAFERFKEIADRKQQISSLDLEAIASDSLRDREDDHHLVSLAITTRTGEPRTGGDHRVQRRRGAARPRPRATGRWTPPSRPSTA